MPYEAPLAANPPLTPALLRLDPMFEPLRKDRDGSKNWQSRTREAVEIT